MSILKQIFGGHPEIPWFWLKCIWMAITKGNLTFHFIYGENLYIESPLLHVRGCKVVATLHQPYDWFKDKSKWVNRLKKLDHIILVAETEISLFEQISGRKNVSFIAHGISDNYYKPCLDVKQKPIVLTVGNWLRDYEFANKVFRNIHNECPNADIVVVSLPANKKYIDKDLNVQFFSGISDDELLNLYRETSCLFLPLKRFTANNALLEAGSVGCNILIASNNADNSYIPEKYIKLLPLQVDVVSKHIIEMINDNHRNIKLSDFVMQNYGWKHIGFLTKKLLLGLSNNSSYSQI